MAELYGSSRNYLLFTDGDNAVVVDSSLNMVDVTGKLSELSSMRPWKRTSTAPQKAHADLASGALSDLKVQVLIASGRMYTIPKAVQEEAKRGLEWRKEEKRGGTSVGLNTARTLANGGQIGIKKIRHIAKYFPRHEVDKKAKGYKPGQDGFPSNGRIAWALWGGDAAWRWAQNIVERENKKAVRADGFVVESDGSSYEDYVGSGVYDSNISAFSLPENSVEFIARTRLDESGIDRLYLLDEEGSLFVWDDGEWDDLGSPDLDVYTIDSMLDDEDDDVEKSHIFIDSDTAFVVSAHLQSAPFAPVSLYDIYPDEMELVASAASEIDWETIDSIVAAGEEPLNSTPGEYTPEERAANARRQVRDATGKFASVGSRVVVDGDSNKRGNITGIDPTTKSVKVQLDSGDSVTVPATSTQKEESFTPEATQTPEGSTQPLDVSGILGQPRAPVDEPKARIPNGLPALTGEDLKQLLGNFPAWVKSQRDQMKVEPVSTPAPKRTDDSEKYVSDLKKKSGLPEHLGKMGDLREHPLTKSLFKKKPIYNLYYNPLISAAISGIGEPVTPETSDVQPLYMAIVSPEDPSAVFDLIAVVPAGTNSTSPSTYKRVDKKWERDDQILADLTSPTPPPVVALSGDNLMNVLMQLDGISQAQAPEDSEVAEETPVAAAGGLDRNRGNAEKLRRYWLYGKGALKIRWNTPGDWTRCYRHLRKYMGPRAKGYCSLRHKEATGTWPGSKYNIGKKNKKILGSAYEEVFIPGEEKILELAAIRARRNDAISRVMTAAGTYETNGHGSATRFMIPLVIPEGVESGDGREFKKDSIEIRDLPLPLLWQIKTADGHSGSVVVGRIDHMERTDDGIGNATGVFDSGSYGKEAERLVREGFIRGVSADLDQFEASEDDDDDDNDKAGKKDNKKIGGGKLSINKARVMAVTIVPKPAFQECKIIVEGSGEVPEEEMYNTPDGVYAEDMGELDADALVACGMIASSIPTVPPAMWFTDPKLAGPTPLTIDETGRVFGHIAAWHVDHIGMTAGTKPPRSKSKYAYFHTGVLRADDGKDYPVGQLTLAGGHASLHANALDAARHYDDTGSAIADVHAGEDRFGIWVAGALRPDATPEQIRALRASAPSGDWRPINGSLELVAVCQVNVPGFPIARARVASGQVYALVAAGAQVLARMKTDPITELAQRIESLESKEKIALSNKAAAAREKIDSVRNAKKAELAARAAELTARVKGAMPEEPVTASIEIEEEQISLNADELRARIASANAEAELGAISRRVRERLAKEGKALPDGAYPIRNTSDLKNAIQAYGRSKESERAKVRRHIIKRARALKRADLIPENWKSASMIEEDVTDIRARVASAKNAIETPEDESK